jgi:hypothetical protein
MAQCIQPTKIKKHTQCPQYKSQNRGLGPIVLSPGDSDVDGTRFRNKILSINILFPFVLCLLQAPEMVSYRTELVSRIRLDVASATYNLSLPVQFIRHLLHSCQLYAAVLAIPSFIYSFIQTCKNAFAYS